MVSVRARSGVAAENCPTLHQLYDFLPDNHETSSLCNEETGVFYQQWRFWVMFIPHGQTTGYQQRIEIRKVVNVKSLKT